MRRHQFSIRALLIVTAIVAVGTAIAASYPLLAACVLLFGVPAALFDIGFRYAANERRPIMAAVAWLVMGILLGGLFMLSANLLRHTTIERDPIQIGFAILCLVFSIVCIALSVRIVRGIMRRDQFERKTPPSIDH